MQHDQDWKRTVLLRLKSRAPDSVTRARAIVAEHLPAQLYRYRGTGKHHLSELRSGSVRLTPAGEFNDPFDCALLVDFRPKVTREIRQNMRDGVYPQLPVHARERFSGIEDLETLIRESLLVADPGYSAEWYEQRVSRVLASQRKKEKEISDRMAADLKRYTRIACFSSSPTSILMWSHYALNHEGMCIAYSTSQSDRQWLERLFPVVYDDARFDLTPWAAAVDGEPPMMAPIIGALHKALDWAYEQEWRVVHSERVDIDPPGLFASIGKPVAVYLGARMPADSEKQVREAAGAIPVFRMQLSRQRYEVEPVAASDSDASA